MTSFKAKSANRFERLSNIHVVLDCQLLAIDKQVIIRYSSALFHLQGLDPTQSQY